MTRGALRKANRSCEHGVAVALNVGDLLLAKDTGCWPNRARRQRVISANDSDCGGRSSVVVSRPRGGIVLVAHAASDGRTGSPRHLPSETAPAFEVALRLGRRTRKRGTMCTKCSHSTAEALGIAYQIRDDLEDFSSEAGAAGKTEADAALAQALSAQRATRRPSFQRIWTTPSVSPSDARACGRSLRNWASEARCRQLLESVQGSRRAVVARAAQSEPEGPACARDREDFPRGDTGVVQ